MSKKEEKSSFLERSYQIFQLLAFQPNRDMIFEDPFPYRIHKENLKDMDIRYLKENPGQVLSAISEGNIRGDLAHFIQKRIGSLMEFDFTAPQMSSCVRYCLEKLPSLEFKIHPVRQLTQQGYTWHRLDFDAADVPTPTFDALMKYVTTNAEALLAFCGALFDSDVQLQQYCWLYGDGLNGKGSLFRFLKKLMGPAYTHLETDRNKLDKFQASALIAKRLAVASDCMNAGFVTTSFFKALTGGDSVQIEEKNKTPYTDHLSTMCMFGSNERPEISSRKADLRRVIFVEFSEVPDDEMIENFEVKLWDERAGILKKMLDAYQKLRISGTSTLKVEKQAEKALAEDSEENFELFFEENFEKCEEGRIQPTKMWKIFSERYKSSRLNRDYVEFKAWLQRSHGIKVKRPDQFKPRQFHGIKLLDTEARAF